jgi:Asp/Glu/hydantoin racemase
MKILVVVPFQMSAENLELRKSQQHAFKLDPSVHLEYRSVKVGPVNYSSHHDFVLADVGIFEAGCRAEQEGFDAVCIDTMSDSGVHALRSVLNIPVIGPGKTAMLTALMLGDKFSLITMVNRWKPLYKKTLDELGIHLKCASIRSIEMPADNQSLLSGKEEEVFPLLLNACEQAINVDGADVLILGSTTMHQSHAYLQQHVRVPIINPGPLSYLQAISIHNAKLKHSINAYPKPMHLQLELFEKMAKVNLP